MTGEPGPFDEPRPFVAAPRGYWRTDAAIRYVDGREVSWTEVVLGDSADDPRAELVSLAVTCDDTA